MEEALRPEELAAAHEFIRRVRRRVPAELVQASLFGSRARGAARPDSDLDVLLVFRWLPPDREPQASEAESLADAVAEESGIPVTTWSVAMVDLEHGNRTPMLVDALADSLPLWCRSAPLPALPFTPQDALRCVRALQERIREGAEEFSGRLARGDARGAARRARDDLVRLCTAMLLLRGITRPRRGDAVRHFVRLERGSFPLTGSNRALLRWAATSYGPPGREDETPVSIPPGGPAAVGSLVDSLSDGVAARARRLARVLRGT